MQNNLPCHGLQHGKLSSCFWIQFEIIFRVVRYNMKYCLALCPTPMHGIMSTLGNTPLFRIVAYNGGGYSAVVGYNREEYSSCVRYSKEDTP